MSPSCTGKVKLGGRRRAANIGFSAPTAPKAKKDLEQRT